MRRAAGFQGAGRASAQSQVLTARIEQTIPRFAHRGPTVASIWLARWWRLQRLDRPPDSHPYEPPLVIAPVNHQILKAGGFPIRVRVVLSDQQVSGTPNVRLETIL
jgi:hypothetical protein